MNQGVVISIHDDSTDDRLADYFRRGIEPSDVPALFSLQRARGAINSLITIFNGTEAAVMARLLVLREAGARAMRLSGRRPSCASVWRSSMEPNWSTLSDDCVSMACWPGTRKPRATA